MQKVKELEWRDAKTNAAQFHEPTAIFDAATPFGTYRIVPGEKPFLCGFTSARPVTDEPIQELKSIAQKHFEETVLSCLQ